MIVVRLLTTLLVLLAALPASAQDRRVPASAAEIRLSYAPIVQRVQPAVVNVYAAKVVRITIPCSTIRTSAVSSACPASSLSRCSVRWGRA